ncbi:GTPase activating protein (GAP) [Coemansia sp. RSA 485]|nr:GTPase activating protein (GAP) [Coemansia sp. RSA 485]
MFVLPAPAEASAFWSDVKHTDNFVLQQSVSSGGAFLRNFLATIQNVLETKPPPYRVVYRHSATSDSFIVLAAGETKEEIDADWKWLSENIMPVVTELTEGADRASFVVTKVRFLATEESGQDVTADRKMRAATNTFRQTFDVGRTENLVTYYSCALQSGFMLHQGWLYLSEHYFCFYSYMFGSEKKVMFQLRDIKDLQKAKTMGGARDDAIEVETKDGSRYVFANMFHRDETFDMLSQLTANTMKRVLMSSEYASSSQQQQQQHHAPSAGAGSHGRSASVSSSATAGVGINPDTRLPLSGTTQPAALKTGASLAEQIAQQRRNEEFRGEFGLPRSETLLSVIETATLALPSTTYVYPGRLYLSSSFVCFVSPSYRGCRITFPMAAIRRIERVSGTDRLGMPCYELVITVWHQTGVSFKVPLDNSECNRWCDALRGQLKLMVEEQRYAKENKAALARYTIKAFTRTCPSEQLLQTSASIQPEVNCLGHTFGYPGNEKELKETGRNRRWLAYFRENGRNLTAIRRAEFDRLIRVGLPNSLRGEIWELSSGAMYLRFQNRGVYDKYVSDYLERKGPYAEEIEKDLTRSLPEYAGYQVAEGIDALRRVLNAYSLRDSELGYCQAMNIVASAMLVFMSEEQVFWTLSVMCDRLVPGYYSPSMYGATLDQSIFQSLVDETMPMLGEAFRRHDIQLSIACLPWFLTLFINSMPLLYALRVLDCFFLDGPKILFQIGLAILKINGAALLEAADDGALLFVLKQYYATLGDAAYPDASSARARGVTRFHELLFVAYTDFPGITHDRIVELRRSHQLRIVHSVQEFSKRTFLRSVVDGGGFTKEQLSLLYDRYYSVLFYSRGNGMPREMTGTSAEDEASDKITLDVYAFARFMYEISSWMRVQIREARERIQNHRNVSLADVSRKKLGGGGGGRAAADDQTKVDDVARETAASLENPGWFIASLFRYASAIAPPKSRLRSTEPASPAADVDSEPSAEPSAELSAEPADAPADAPALAGLRVSFQQCVIALGRIVNTDLLTRMDVFFDMFACTHAGSITRREVFQLSEALLYIGHGEDVEAGDRRRKRDEDVTNEEHLLRSVSGFLQRAVSYGEKLDAGRAADFLLPRNMFRVVVLEDEFLEEFFAESVPASFRFTDGVELANPLRAISTHQPTTPLTPRAAESTPARLLAGGRSVAEGMSARLAQTIALGSQFVDRRMLTPVVRSAAQAQKQEQKQEQTPGFVVTTDVAAATQLSNAPPDDALADEMARMLLRDGQPSDPKAADVGDPPDGPLEPQVVPDKPLWANAPLEPAPNAPLDPYENLLDEVDELLGEIKDDDEAGGAISQPGSEPQPPAVGPSRAAASKAANDLDFQIDDDDDDDDLTHLLRG